MKTVNNTNFKPAKQPAKQRLAYTAWSTEHELEFIDGLGTGKFKSRIKIPRLELLILYITSFRFRTNWAYIDEEAVLEYAVASAERCADGTG